MTAKEKKFRELAAKRVNKTIKYIRLIGNLSNRNNYEYSDSDVKKLFSALQKELSDAKKRYDNSAVEETDYFSF